MAKLSVPLHPTIKVFSLYGDVSTNAIILIWSMREDYGQVVSISVPTEFVPCVETKAAFAATKVIDWSDSYVFSPLDRLVSQMVVEISTVYKSNSTKCSPCRIFYLDNQDISATLEDKIYQEGYKLLPLDLSEGVNFLVDGWPYRKPSTAKYLRRVLEDEKVPSVGLHVDGHIVSAAFMNINGLVGMLSTKKKEQGKGYATKVMQHLLKIMANRGFIPCSPVEVHNETSIRFHEKLGLQVSHECDLVSFNKDAS